MIGLIIGHLAVTESRVAVSVTPATTGAALAATFAVVPLHLAFRTGFCPGWAFL